MEKGLKNPPRNPPQNSPRTLLGKILLGFLQKPFLTIVRPPFACFISDSSALEIREVNLLFCLGLARKTEKNRGLNLVFKEDRVFKVVLTRKELSCDHRICGARPLAGAGSVCDPHIQTCFLDSLWNLRSPLCGLWLAIGDPQSPIPTRTPLIKRVHFHPLQLGGGAQQTL